MIKTIHVCTKTFDQIIHSLWPLFWCHLCYIHKNKVTHRVYILYTSIYEYQQWVISALSKQYHVEFAMQRTTSKETLEDNIVQLNTMPICACKFKVIIVFWDEESEIDKNWTVQRFLVLLFYWVAKTGRFYIVYRWCGWLGREPGIDRLTSMVSPGQSCPYHGSNYI